MKTLSQGLVLTILFAISIFFAVTYINTYVRNSPNTESQQLPTNPQINAEEQPVVTEPVEQKVFYSTLPRTAKELNYGEKINNIGGYGKETLCNYYVIGQFLYIIFMTDSNSCDVQAEASNIAVAKLNLEGTLLQVLTLKSDSNVMYMASNLFDYGIMIIAKQQNNTIIYTITEELSHSRLIMPYNTDSCLLRYTYPYSILMLTQGNKLTALALDSSLNITFSISHTFNNSISLLDCYLLNNYYLFANVNNVGTIIQFDSSGILKITAVCPTSLKEVMPTENGYLLSTIKEGVATLIWLNREATQTDAIRLAQANNVKLAYTGKGYLILTYGEVGQGKSFFVCRHGDIISQNDTDLSNIKQVTSIEYGKGDIIITALIHGTDNTTILYNFDINHYKASPVMSVSGISAPCAFGCIVHNKSIIIYNSTQNVLTHLNNWGGQDIFVRVSEALQ